ncbi:Putative inorganic phosphate cotransporter [Gryllus bimaculatus]|nr:Putative inorganic phosphate cotransporter [Gryllus bimaculatus]
MPVSGILCDSQLLGGWPLVFYATGAIGILWYIPWLLCVFDTPAQHPRISQAERRFIETALHRTGQKKKLPIPWKKILATPGLWACASMHLGIGWNFFGQITYLPSYMGEILHYKIENNAALSAIPYVLGGLSSLASTITLDALITRKIVRPLTGFKIFNAMTGVGAAITLALLPLAGCNRILINVLLALNGISLGAQYAGNGTNLLVLAPNFAGTMYGISNTMANAAGILAPYAVGFLTYGNQTRSAWNIMFYISAAIGALSFIIYWVLCSEEEEAWNNPLPLEEVTSGDNNNKSKENGSNEKSHENKAYEPDA